MSIDNFPKTGKIQSKREAKNIEERNRRKKLNCQWLITGQIIVWKVKVPGQLLEVFSFCLQMQ